MIVFYDNDTGAVTSILHGKTLPPTMQAKPHIQLAEPVDLGELQGWSVVEGELVLSDLTPVRIRAIEEINRISGIKRGPMITDIPGQEMIYLRKEEEAKSYIANPAPDMVDYPMLQAETGVTAPDAYALSQLWLNMSAMLRQMAAGLERARMQAINDVNAAQSREAIEAVLASFRAL